MVDEPAYRSNGHRPDSNSWIPHTSLQSADGENNTTKVKSWVCEHCHRSFGREEHLERHVTRHLGLRPFMCPICSKPFSRRDTLRRHLNTHGLPAAQIAALSKSPRGSACINCAIAKQKCDRSLPCGRCRLRNLPCTGQSGGQSGGQSAPTDPSQSPAQYQQFWDFRTSVGAAAVEFPASSAAREAHSGLEDSTGRASEFTTHVDPATNFAYGAASDVFFSGFSNSGPDTDSHTSCPGNLMDAWFFPFASWDSGDPSLEPDRWNGTATSRTGAKRPAPSMLSPGSQQVVPAHEYFSALGQVNTVDQAGTTGGELPEADSTQMQHDNTQHVANNEPPQSRAASKPYALSATTSSAPCPCPQVLPSDSDVLVAEDFGHVPRVSSDVYERILQFAHFQHEKSSPRSVDLPIFPSIDTLNSFIQLYFEYFHPQIPLLHVATFNPGVDDWMLVIAVAAIGCQHSAVSNRDGFTTALMELLHQAILRKLMHSPPMETDLSFGQTVFLHQFSMVFSGTTQTIVNSQYQRSVLATVCRPFLSREGTLFRGPQGPDPGQHDSSWIHWVSEESWTRLLYFTWYMECSQVIMWDIPPIFLTAEFHQRLPASESLWHCTTAAEWKAKTGEERGYSESASLASLFGKHFISQELLHRLGDSARLVLMTSLYVEEKRMVREMGSWLYLRPEGRPGRNRDNPAAKPMPDAFPLDSEPSSLLAKAFEMCRNHPGSNTASTPLATTHEKAYHILSVLRRVSQRSLNMFFGWMTTESGTELAKRELARWMNHEQRSAREALLHAALLFRMIRDQTTTTYCDPVWLLIAALYMRAYVEIEGNARSARSAQQNSFCTAKPIRIDYPLDDATKRLWLESSDTTAPLHVTGIGNLTSADTGPRIFKETIRVLNRNTGWSRYARAAAHTLGQVLQSSIPRLDESP